MWNVSTLASQNIPQMTLRVRARHPVETYRFFIAIMPPGRGVAVTLERAGGRRIIVRFSMRIAVIR